MAELYSIPATAGDLDRPQPISDGTYLKAFMAAVEAGVLCRCGSTIAERDRDDPAVPLREDGGRRGACRCFRARARQVPIGAVR